MCCKCLQAGFSGKGTYFLWEMDFLEISSSDADSDSDWDLDEIRASYDQIDSTDSVNPGDNLSTVDNARPNLIGRRVICSINDLSRENCWCF